MNYGKCFEAPEGALGTQRYFLSFNVNYQQTGTCPTAPSLFHSFKLRLSLVGAKYLHRLNDIIRVVENVTSHLAIKLLTYFAEKTEVMPLVDINNSPAIVRNFKY